MLQIACIARKCRNSWLTKSRMPAIFPSWIFVQDSKNRFNYAKLLEWLDQWELSPPRRFRISMEGKVSRANGYEFLQPHFRWHHCRMTQLYLSSMLLSYNFHKIDALSYLLWTLSPSPTLFYLLLIFQASLTFSPPSQLANSTSPEDHRLNNQSPTLPHLFPHQHYLISIAQATHGDEIPHII